MVVISNGQSSGGSSDLNGKRLDARPSHKKKPRTPPSPKEKPDPLDGSTAIRNHGTPMDVNPKDSFGSKHKRTVASVKTARGDDAAAAEEQRESKKKSASKEKKTGEAEAAPSNPITKKLQKQQQEFTAGVATPTSVKDSSQKSPKKMDLVCAANDETVVMRGCLDSSRKIPDQARVAVMKEKWRKFQIREFEVRLKRIALMQEVCSMQVEVLKESSAKFGQ